MKTSLMNNFIYGNRQAFLSAQNNVVQNSSSDIELVTKRKEKPEFDINKELANRTYIRPLPPKGHIVKSNILSAPLNFVQEVKSDLKALNSAVVGDANDHQLGKLNDIGMKLGGLAIASYLYTMKHAPVTKIMEFVGLGSFFASMAIWPKIALDIPARLIHGFSPFMRYEDSQGRKKGFFSDNQYIPFDMLSDKDINRIGNRLRIPKNLTNRREAVEEKMRQIALQNNTMWMLTAGFATPIMSSLICNYTEPYIEDFHNRRMNKRVDKILSDFNTQREKYASNEIINKVNTLISTNHDRPITTEMIESFADALSSRLDSNVKIGIRQDLDNLFNEGKFRINDTQLNGLSEAISGRIKEVGEGKVLSQVLENIIPTEKQLNTLFSENGYFEKNLNKIEVGEIISEISKLIQANIDKEISSGGIIKPHMQRRIVQSLNGESAKVQNTIQDILTTNNSRSLDAEAQKIIKDFAKYINEFCTDNSALSDYAYNKLAFAPNTAKANYWNDVVSSLIKDLNITPKEIEDTRYDRKLVGELFNKKIWEIAAGDSTTYQNFVANFAQKISQIENNVKPSVLTGEYFGKLTETFNAAATNCRKIGFNATAERVVGNGKSERGSLIGATKSFVNSNMHNVESTFTSVLNKANIFRTLFQNPDFKFLSNSYSIPKEIKEEITGLIEYLTTEGRISDYTVKFDFVRNPNPNLEDKGGLVFDNGKLIYSYYNPKKLETNGIIIKTDTNFFKRVMKTMFNIPLAEDTRQALAKNSTASSMLENYRHNMYNIVGNIENFMFPETVVGDIKRYDGGAIRPDTYTSATPKFRTNAVGAALDETLANNIRQIYNTAKWKKMFGRFGAGLLGFTVLSQFLFGHSDGKYKTKAKE